MRIVPTGILIGLCLLAVSRIEATQPAAPALSPSAAGFHHLHLNSVDPARAIDWYTRTFAVTKRATVAGFDGISSERIHLLFSKVASPPPSTLESAIWHFGWGSPDMAGDFARHQANGVEFATPLSKLAQGTVFAYMRAPDAALVEINSAQSHAFVHVHLYSAKPLCAADWYITHLGGVSRAKPRTGDCDVPYGAPSEPLAVIRSPAATVRFDDISVIIYPQQRPGTLLPTRGRVVDHIALSVKDLPGTLARLQAAGINVLQGVHPFGGGPARAAFIEGPDSIVIELVEQP